GNLSGHRHHREQGPLDPLIAIQGPGRPMVQVHDRTLPAQEIIALIATQRKELAMTTGNNEIAVHAHLDKWLDASRTMNLDALHAGSMPGMVSYACHSAFQFKGIDPYSKHLEMCFSHMVAPAVIDVHELSITAGDDIAFCHMTMHCGCTSQS